MLKLLFWGTCCPVAESVFWRLSLRHKRKISQIVRQHQLNKPVSLTLGDYLITWMLMFFIVSPDQCYGDPKEVLASPIATHNAYQIIESCQVPYCLIMDAKTHFKKSWSVFTCSSSYSYCGGDSGLGHGGLEHSLDHLATEWCPFLVIQQNLQGYFMC